MTEITLPDAFGPESIEDFTIIPLIESINEFQQAQINEFLFPQGDPDDNPFQDDESLNPDDITDKDQLFEYDTDQLSDSYSEPTPNAIPPPPIFDPCDTDTEAMQSVENWARENGFAVVLRRTDKDRKMQINGRYLICNKGRKHHGKTTLIRKSRSQRENCPFQISIRRHYNPNPDSDSNPTPTWVIKTMCGEHSHGPTDCQSHAIYRRQSLAKHRDTIISQIQQGIRPSQILAGLRTKDDNCLLEPRDIYNLRRKLYVEFLAGRTPTQALISTLADNGDWKIIYEKEDDQLISVFCMHKTSIQMLRQNPHILFMDCTYKTNRYRMPMLNIIGLSPNNASFFVGLGFISNEQEESFHFILRGLQKVYTDLNLLGPETVFIDKDNALINALELVFPATKVLLCIWHINKNILSKAKFAIQRALIGSINISNPGFLAAVNEKWKEMLSRWMKVVYASTVSDKLAAWNDFKTQYNSEIFHDILTYVEKEWLDNITAKRFLSCYTKHYLTFGNIATSRIESGHRLLKRDLEVSTNDLLETVRSFERTILQLYHRVQSLIARDRSQTFSALNISLFAEVHGKISSFALFKAFDSYKKIVASPRIEDGLHTHEGITFKSQGLPCIHAILTLHHRHLPLQMHHFHRQWWIQPLSQEPLDPRLLVQDPAVIRTRGRPTGAQNKPKKSSQRDLSAFEHTEQAISRGKIIKGRGRGRGHRQRS